MLVWSELRGYLATELQEGDPHSMARKQQVLRKVSLEWSMFSELFTLARSAPAGPKTTRKGPVHWGRAGRGNGVPSQALQTDRGPREETPGAHSTLPRKAAAASPQDLSSPTWSLSPNTMTPPSSMSFCSHGPCLKWPSSREVLSTHQTSEAAHDAPLGHQAPPQGHTDPTKASSRLPQRRPLPG